MCAGQELNFNRQEELMERIRSSDVRHVAKLAEIDFSGEEVEKITPQLDKILDQPKGNGNVSDGAYVVKDSDNDPDLILIGSGAELHICMEAALALEQDGIGTRVVSMPSWELFSKSPEVYKERILPEKVTKRIAVEAGISMGWERFTGKDGKIISIDKFGASAPGNKVLAEYGFTSENIVEKAKEMLK